MEREKFDGSWRKAFEKAEISPSDQVWTNIELDLEKAKGDDLKRRLFFYQMLAAASVVFALAIGGAGFYYNISQNGARPQQIAVHAEDGVKGNVDGSEARQDRNSPPTTTPQSVADRGDEAGTAGDDQDRGHSGQRRSTAVAPVHEGSGLLAEGTAVDHTSLSNTPAVTSASITDDYILTTRGRQLTALSRISREEGTMSPMDIDDHELAPFYTLENPRLVFTPEEQQPDPVAAMLAQLKAREEEIMGKEDVAEAESSSDETLWTSVGFAAGPFNSVQAAAPSSGPAPGTAMTFAAPMVDQETSASGLSYSVGVNVGTRLSGRWVLQGGINYLTHSSDYTANNVVVASTAYQQQRFRAMSTNELINADMEDLNSKIVYSAPYSVNNSMRYLSIPLQAGYLVVDKTFGVQLNAGVATDLFLQNTIKADSDQLDKTSQPGGSDSPYRSVNLSGLFGTELSYRFGDNYRISLNPGIRYPFNTIYKSELGVQSTPLTFDVGLRFRYIFH